MYNCRLYKDVPDYSLNAVGATETDAVPPKWFPSQTLQEGDTEEDRVDKVSSDYDTDTEEVDTVSSDYESETDVRVPYQEGECSFEYTNQLCSMKYRHEHQQCCLLPRLCV